MPPTSQSDASTTQAHLDRLSLEQALLDVEVANARVIDLTARLAEQSAELRTLRARLAEVSAPRRPSLRDFSRVPAGQSMRAVVRAVLPPRARQLVRRLLR